MNRNLEYVIALRDKFTSVLSKVGLNYDNRLVQMTRRLDVFSSRFNSLGGMFSKISQSAEVLSRKLRGIDQPHRVKVDDSDLDRTSRKTGGLLGMLKNLASSSTLLAGLAGGGIAGLAMGAVEMVSQSIGAIHDKTIGAAQRDESTMFRLNELMGKDIAAGVVSSIDKYMPSRRAALIDGATKLSGAGVAPGKMMDTLTALNNISAITGQSVDQLAMIQAKIKSTGYAQGDQIQQITEGGPSLAPYLAKVMGVGENQIAKLQAAGKITYDVFDKAMQAYAGKGGRFDGAALRTQDLTEGKESALVAKWDAIMLKLGQKLLPFKNSILDLLSGVMDVAGPVFNFLSELFNKIWWAIRPVWDGVVGLIGYFGNLMQSGDALSGVFAYLNEVLDVAKWILWGISNVIGWLVEGPLGKLIVGIWAAVAAWGAFNFVMNMNPILRIISLFIAFAGAVMYAWDTWDGFRESLVYSWAVIKDIFGNVGEFMLKLFSMDFAGALAVLGRTVSSAGAAGRAAVVANRSDRKRERDILEGAQGSGGTTSLDFTNPDKPGGSLGDAAGITSTVGNSKSNTITINIGSLIAKSEISVMDFKDGLDDIESKLIDALLRVANSGSRAVTA